MVKFDPSIWKICISLVGALYVISLFGLTEGHTKGVYHLNVYL